jgi:hypothetical protein
MMVLLSNGSNFITRPLAATKFNAKAQRSQGAKSFYGLASLRLCVFAFDSVITFSLPFHLNINTDNRRIFLLYSQKIGEWFNEPRRKRPAGY